MRSLRRKPYTHFSFSTIFGSVKSTASVESEKPHCADVLSKGIRLCAECVCFKQKYFFCYSSILLREKK